MKLLLKTYVLILMLSAQFTFAQKQPDKFQVTLSAEDLYSTHSTHFVGIAGGINRRFSEKFSAGIGIEYSYGSYHDDNGWNLYKLNFTPVYLSQNFYPVLLNRFKPYIHLREGLSFINYNKESQDNPGPQTHVNEKGFYGYGGIGTCYRLKQNLDLFIEAGIKSFHISTNELEVNPHGFTSKIGLKFSFR